MCICNEGVLIENFGSLIEFKKCPYCDRENGLKKLKDRMDAFYGERSVHNDDRS